MTITSIHIRILHPQPIYAISEAATLLEMDWRDLRGWMETGEVEGIETDEGRFCRGRSLTPSLMTTSGSLAKSIGRPADPSRAAWRLSPRA